MVAYDTSSNSKYAAISASFFYGESEPILNLVFTLRTVKSFISPAVVSPDTIDIEIPKENNTVLSRGLMLIAKIVQSLAKRIYESGHTHTDKKRDTWICVATHPNIEEHMSCIINFLGSQIIVVRVLGPNGV